MALQFSTTVRNARLLATEVAIGASPQLRVYAGSMPLNVGTPDSAVLLAILYLPADFFDAPNTGVMDKLGSWHTDEAVGAGNATYFRIFDNAGTTCHVQGTISALGGTGDLQLDNVNFAVGQAFTVSAFELLEGNGPT